MNRAHMLSETNSNLPPDIIEENKKFNKRFARGISKYEYWKNRSIESNRREKYYKHYTLKHKAKVAELKKEITLMRLEREVLVKEHKKEITKLTRRVAELFERCRKYKQMLLLYKKNGKKRTKEFLVIKKQLRTYFINKRFFTKELKWYDESPARLERVMHMLFHYEQLRLQNIANMKEMVFLFAGKQLEYFYLKDVANKFGTEWVVGYQKLLYQMCKLSYIKQIPRKKAWFITDLGEKRLADMMNSICKGRPKQYITNLP